MSSITPARRAAYEVVRRVFEQEAYADRAFVGAAKALDERDRALAQQHRLRHGAASSRARPRHRDARPPARAQARPARAGGAPRSARISSRTSTAFPTHAAVNESVELVRRARLERAVPFTNAVMRRLSEGLRELLDRTAGRAAQALVPRLDRDIWERDFGREQAITLMHAQNESPETTVRARARRGGR